MGQSIIRTTVFTIAALIAFAANSVLARMALSDGAIDAGGYTVVRLASGAMVLAILLGLGRTPSDTRSRGSWAAGLMLFVYAATFSYAYISLDTGSGALILFGAVQITMIVVSVIAGDRPGLAEWTGLVLAFAGFVWLVLPGVSTPSANGFVLMTISGIAWGLYTLRGRNSKNPLADTACNFIRTIPMIAIVLLITFRNADFSLRGVVLAALSGGIASGLGYTMWYTALGGLSATQAAVLQLLVPVIAAVGGIFFVSESITLRLAVSAALILSGILMVLLGRRARA